MPVLDLSISVGSGKYVACFEVVIFRSPRNIAERRLVFFSNCIREIFVLHMKYLDLSVLASCFKPLIPAAMYLSWLSNLIEWIFMPGYPSVK